MRSPSTFSIPSRALADAGLSIDLLCGRAGVALAPTWNTPDFFRLWTAADELLRDPSAGLRFGTHGVEQGYGVAAIVALHAPDFRHALTALSRYKRLTCPECIDVDIVGDEVAVRYRWLEANGEVPRLLVDTTMASLSELAHRGTDGQVSPIRLELARRMANKVLLSRHFGCPVVFGATYDAMVFHRDALDALFVTADRPAFDRLLDGLEERLTEAQGFSQLIGTIRVAIARQLSEGRPATVAAMACRLGTTTRTLQRRLAECSTSFQQQLDAVRRTTASRLLAHTDLDAVAIALLVGFVEPNSFARAFRGWEQTTPASWRRHRAASAP